MSTASAYGDDRACAPPAINVRKRAADGYSQMASLRAGWHFEQSSATLCLASTLDPGQ
jgi:hypothetical protein